MSLIKVLDQPAAHTALLFRLGCDLVKTADDPKLVYNLAGRLYLSDSGWLMLTVPNAMVRGVFAAMAEPGIELPPSGSSGTLEAHISVMRPSDIESIGGPDKITERGKQFAYTLGRIYSVVPETWSEMRRVWYLQVFAPELQELRRSYGLTGLPNDGKYDFHVTIGVLRKKVLGRNAAAKGGPP